DARHHARPPGHRAPPVRQGHARPAPRTPLDSRRMQETDALGRTHAFAAPPRRIVSLVPSWTELLFALDAGRTLVGVTEFCVHPAEGVAGVRKIGGTKNPDLRAIETLRPELVVANKEENRRR